MPTKLSAVTNDATAFDGTELTLVVQAGNSAKARASDFKTYALGDFSAPGLAVTSAASYPAMRTAMGLGSAALEAIGTSGATVPLLSTANTWDLAQTFTVAPVFTDGAGARTALGLGTAALAATGTSGATLPFANGANTWVTTQTFTVAPVFTDATNTRTALGLGTVATLASDTDGTLAANSDTRVATQKATKTYVDAAVTAGVTFATTGEVNTGTNTTKVVNPDVFAGSNYGKRTVSILVTDPNGSALTTGAGKAYWRVPAAFNGMNLVEVAASLDTVSSSGIPTVQLRRKRSGSDVDMLSTGLTIYASETDSSTAAAAAVIDAANDDIATGDRIYIDQDVAGTGAKGLLVEMTFQLP